MTGDITTNTTDGRRVSWPRPVPTVGDRSSARERAEDLRGWAFSEDEIDALARVVMARRDIRRFRPDPVPDALVREVLSSGHLGPSVGHCQPWRFIVVSDPHTRERAAAMADSLRLQQAAGLQADRGQRLLDLKLEGLREAPLGVVVACDRRAPAEGVLGRASFPDADLWSCACAIENMWLTARAHGLGMGWVTLFRPEELADLLHLPEGVQTLGWLCLGWPDERPPEPGLQRAAWSRRLPLDEVVVYERWPQEDGRLPQPPLHYLHSPDQSRVVSATDEADALLSPPGSLGVLDRALDRLVAAGAGRAEGGTLVLVGADHPVADLGVSAYAPSVTRDVMSAAVAGESMGVVAAAGAGLEVIVVDAGVRGGPVAGARDLRPVDGARGGDLMHEDPLSRAQVESLISAGRVLGAEAAGAGLVVLGEVGVGNTTVAAALSCAVTGLKAQEAVGLGAGSDAAIMARKVEVVSAALSRMAQHDRLGRDADPVDLLAGVGGAEFAVLTGVVLGAAGAGTGVVLDGLATCVPALLARQMEPAVHAYLVAGQQSRERAHGVVLRELGAEPLLSLRLRAGEGIGASMAASLLAQGLRLRRVAGRTS
ncbi:cob(II)yrinic acid a,c-diamide reductase [Austwickia chelonae]|uniref:Nicotinate-nucleotide--dimethylbenzimidazole phosphoribosyltransferase n=1 Tax=Austwickia chelonae NBRC 105200 TaxID=1184607 RepID=K6W404_9MICO|nr:5,6-dimethylbenzimidazole synthase [Austwickia chelonae]GAB76522.1 putative oxidoreductase [Austwickia chelonae NBRC 105200]SEW26141.1 cob(II)yrinic acid a,c-diamide reductase [Austwickia chelonae]